MPASVVGRETEVLRDWTDIPEAVVNL